MDYMAEVNKEAKRAKIQIRCTKEFQEQVKLKANGVSVSLIGLKLYQMWLEGKIDLELIAPDKG